MALFPLISIPSPSFATNLYFTSLRAFPFTATPIILDSCYPQMVIKSWSNRYLIKSMKKRKFSFQVFILIILS